MQTAPSPAPYDTSNQQTIKLNSSNLYLVYHESKSIRFVEKCIIKNKFLMRSCKIKK